MLPIGQLLWEKELESLQGVPAAAGAGDLQPHGDFGCDEEGRSSERLTVRSEHENRAPPRWAPAFTGSAHSVSFRRRRAEN